MKAPDFLREIPGIALTAARYGLAERLARKIDSDESITGSMLGLMAADVADGVALRAIGMDTPVRRTADGIVDQASVVRVAYEVSKKYPESKPYIGVLAARAAAVDSLNLLHFFRTGEVTKGHANQKAAYFATAIFGLIATLGNRKVTNAAGIITSAIAVGTAIAHLKDLGIRHENGIREV